MKLALILIAALCISACGRAAPQATHSNPSLQPKIFTSADLFPVKVGDNWPMVNNLGDKTFWEVLPGPRTAACETGDIFIIHISKDNDRTYWNPNIHGAEDFYYVKRDADGTWRGIQDSPKAVLPNLWN